MHAQLTRKRPIAVCRTRTLSIHGDVSVNVPESALYRLCKEKKLTTPEKLDEFLEPFGMQYTDPEAEEEEEEQDKRPKSDADSKEELKIDFLEENSDEPIALSPTETTNTVREFNASLQLKSVLAMLEAVGIDPKKEDVSIDFCSTAKYH